MLYVCAVLDFGGIHCVAGLVWLFQIIGKISKLRHLSVIIEPYNKILN